MAKQKSENETVDADFTKTKTSEPADWADGTILLADGEDRLYFKCEVGNVITGFLNGESEFEDKDGRMVGYFVVHTDRVTKVTSADEKTPFDAPRGSMVYVNKRAQLLALEDFAGTDEVVWVGMEAIKKRTISGGRTVWSFKMAVKPTGRKRPKLALQTGPSQSEETPF